MQEPSETQKRFRLFWRKRPDFEALRKKLDLKESEWDAISFFRGPDNEYNFSIIKYKMKNEKAPEYEMHPHGLGHKYIFLYSEKKEMIREEFTVGDPIWVLLNVWVKAKMEGFIMKKCPESSDMADKIIKNRQMTIRTFKTLVKGNVATEV